LDKEASHAAFSFLGALACGYDTLNWLHQWQP